MLLLYSINFPRPIRPISQMSLFIECRRLSNVFLVVHIMFVLFLQTMLNVAFRFTSIKKLTFLQCRYLSFLWLLFDGGIYFH
jgi:hypothetical protein